MNALEDQEFGLAHYEVMGVIEQADISADNLYKIFTPGWVERTILDFGLDSSPEEIMNAWKKLKDTY